MSGGAEDLANAGFVTHAEGEGDPLATVGKPMPLPEAVRDEIERLEDEWGVLTVGIAKQIARFAMLYQARIDAEICNSIDGGSWYACDAAKAIRKAAGIE